MFLSIFVNGLAMGMVYALLSLGLILLVRATGALNMAQGDLMSIGAYVTFFLTSALRLPLVVMLIVSLVIFAILAAIFMATTYLPVRKNKWIQARIVCTLGASFIIKDALVLIFGPRTTVVPPIIRGNVRIFGAPVQIQYLFIIGVCLLVMLLIYFLFEKMYLGKAMQAAAQNPFAAETIGIPVIITILMTYIAVFAVAGIAGWLVVPTYYLSPNLSTYQLRAFAGCVIGGFGDIRGAIIGSLLVGLVEAASVVVSSTYKDIIVYGLLILVLIVRPKGLFASKQGVKV
jgi:branched-chain amino acid transport system permease protein